MGGCDLSVSMGMWQVMECTSEIFWVGGGVVSQSPSMNLWHREERGHPLGGLKGEGRLPSSTISSRFDMETSAMGTAARSASV